MIKSFNLTTTLLNKIKEHNKELESEINLKVGQSLLLNTILELYYTDPFAPGVKEMQLKEIKERILAVKNEKIQKYYPLDKYPYRIKKGKQSAV